MNWQHCRNMAFVGMSDSYEQQYQAIRRCWRYGQAKPVNVWQIVSEADGDVVANIQRKEREHVTMMDSLIQEMNIDGGMMAAREEMEYSETEASGKGWRLLLGDSAQRIKEIESDSIGLSVFSPPFPGMYTYSNSPRDIGNCADLDELVAHFSFLIPDLYRITMPGRSCAIHLTQQVAFKGTDGFTGLRDFRGRVIDAMTKAGWIYYGEVTIDKNPQVKAIRTKDAGLQFKSLATDSARMHMALADYILQFKKPGDNPRPIRAGVSEKYQNPNGWITQREWIEWAAPVWYGDFRGLPGGIRETDVLNVAQARDTNDERHLCPLQLGVIERCVKLWSAPGDIVLSPFAGIGSEGHEAVRLHRQFIGIELKPSYYQSAVRNLRQAEEMAQREQNSLLSFIEQAEAAQELGVELQPEHVEDRTFDNLVAAGFASVPSEDVYGAKELTVTFTSEPEPVKPKKERKAKAAKAKPATFLEDSSLLSEMMDL
jgi:DNA modification methylase